MRLVTDAANIAILQADSPVHLRSLQDWPLAPAFFISRTDFPERFMFTNLLL
jgi:hypothetical protein